MGRLGVLDLNGTSAILSCAITSLNLIPPRYKGDTTVYPLPPAWTEMRRFESIQSGLGSRGGPPECQWIHNLSPQSPSKLTSRGHGWSLSILCCHLSLHPPALGHLGCPAPAPLKVQAMCHRKPRVRACSAGHPGPWERRVHHVRVLGSMHTHCSYQTFKPWKALHSCFLFFFLNSSVLWNFIDRVVLVVPGIWLLQTPCVTTMGYSFLSNSKKGWGLKAEARGGSWASQICEHPIPRAWG